MEKPLDAGTAERILVLAPTGRDGSAACALLGNAAMLSISCADLEDLRHELEAGTAVAVIAEEALLGADLGPLFDWVNSQPPWSDFPFIILTTRRDDPRLRRYMLGLIDNLRNVTLQERPIQGVTLVSAAKAALRARLRQYQAGRYLAEREEAANRLEELVRERTRQLQEMNNRLTATQESLTMALEAAQMKTWNFDIAEFGIDDSPPREALSMLCGSLVAEWGRDTGERLLSEHQEALEAALQQAFETGNFRVEGRVVTPVDELRRVYVTTGDNYSDPPTDTSDAILAFNADTGELAWSRQMTTGDVYNLACVSRAETNCPLANGPDYDFGSSAVLVDLPGGKRALIAAQKSGVVTAVDPDRRGEIIWQKKVGRGGRLGGVQWGVAADRSNVYVAVSDVRIETVAPGVPGARISPVNPKIAFLLDNEVGGGLHALNIATGKEIWETPNPGCNGVPGCSPAQSAAVTAIPGIVFSGGLDGHLRAYSAKDGHIVWDVDTKTGYQTVDGLTAHGGSIDGPGAVVVGGMLYLSSGYNYFGRTPGNVLLDFSVDGR
jgi:outer membrane protein assembly factor BamB